MSDDKQQTRHLKVKEALSAARGLLRHCCDREIAAMSGDGVLRFLDDYCRSVGWRQTLLTRWYMTATDRELSTFVHGHEYWRRGRDIP